jgi:hypothetical protein
MDVQQTLTRLNDEIDRGAARSIAHWEGRLALETRINKLRAALERILAAPQSAADLARSALAED